MTTVSIISEGGAMRGAYSLGVLHALYHHYGLRNIDYASGSSAGISNLAYYITGLIDEAVDIWTNYVSTPNFSSPWNIFKGKPLVDIDYLIDIFKTKTALTSEKINSSKTKLIAPLTNSLSGKVEYFDNRHKIDFMEVLRAETAMPILYGKRIHINEKPYFDGGASDPLPVDYPGINTSMKIIILTRTEDDFTRNRRMDKLFFKSFKTIGKLTEIEYDTLMRKELIYNNRVAQVMDLRRNGNILLMPSIELKRFDNSKKNIDFTIEQGKRDAINSVELQQFIKFLKNDGVRYFMS